MSANRSLNSRGAGLLGAVKRRLGAPASQAAQDIAYLEASGLFDRSGYLEMYPDVAESGIDAIRHYVLHGARENRNPCLLFNTKYYRETNPDVAASGINPFRHFCEFGWREGRDPTDSFKLRRYAIEAGLAEHVNPFLHRIQNPPVEANHSRGDAEIFGVPGLFDESFYLSHNPDIKESGMKPFDHFIRYGSKEGRNPCDMFDSEYYLKRNPDVARAGMSPFRHFCLHGWYELRDPSPLFDITRYWLEHMVPIGAQGNPLAHFGVVGQAGGQRPMPVGATDSSEQALLIDRAEKLLLVGDHESETLEMLGRVCASSSRWPAAESAFRSALAARWDSARLQNFLAKALEQQGKWWQSVESLQAATALAPKAPAEWWFRLGEAQERMNRFDEAATAYQKALSLKPDNADWQYRLGYVASMAGQAEVSVVAYSKAIDLDERAEVKRFGVGVFHQARSYWPEAAAAYKEELGQKPLCAELYFRLGMAHDRCYRWQDALDAYASAISLDPESKPYWHYRYGFVLERLARWGDASLAYAIAARLSAKEMPYWRYRQGYTLAMAGCYEQACSAYIAMRKDRTVPGAEGSSSQRGAGGLLNMICGVSPGGVNCTPMNADADSYLAAFDPTGLIRDALNHDFSRADLHYKLGEFFERRKDWESAASAYQRALARSNQHQPKWFYLLGYVLFRMGRFNEACEAFQQTYIIQRAYGLSQEGLKRGPEMLRLSTHYGEYLETLPVNDKVIFYDSHLGKSASCNPLAMFNYLAVHPIYKDYLHVWAINDPERVPDAMLRMTNVVIVQRHTDLFLRYLATAKYLISNSILPQYFVRRAEQKCLATWHGTPLKTLGKQQQYKFQEHKRAQRFFLQSTHIISPNPHTTDVLLDSYDLRHIMAGRLAETGYPRLDLTINASEERRKELREQLGVSGDKPVVLYAPTWRGTLETVSYEVDRAKSDLEYLAKRHDCDVVFRGHHLMESLLGSGEALGCKVASATIDTNELLSVVDVLITDYSSIFFDFLATGKPILYYIYDQDDYQRERGLYFSMDEMPGYKCKDVECLSKCLGLALQGELHDEQRSMDARKRFNLHDDGMASKRVADFLFDDDPSHVIDRGPRKQVSLLMQGGGFKRNGITTSFLNLLKHIDRSTTHITVAISPDAIEGDPECLDQFSRVPEDVAVVARHGLLVMTWEERWLRRHYERSRLDFSEEQMAIVRHLFDREFQRIFGNVKFDVAVSFSGYDNLWGSILNLSEHDIRKVIYMHNDMREEYAHRFPELMRMFRLYKSADCLVGVCEESTNVNRTNLASWLGIPESRFTTSENVQDPERIIELSRADVEAGDEHLFRGEPVFVNMGRLSVEKSQDKLIRAFARLCAEKGPMKLLILGVGPLKQYLQNLIDKLGMADSIYLLGLRSNPYPYLKRAGCFVLSSNHEAKCMSLIEALIVGLPCVATDISGNRDIKRDFPEYFFENSEDGLHEGMLKFLEGSLPVPIFDTKMYQEEALRQFESRVLNLGRHNTHISPAQLRL